MQREKFKSRLGFILISAGCAIGIGNVWRFPYIVGNNGGGIFVLFYLLFLVVLGVPLMTMEFSVGRASQKSAIKAFNVLEKDGQKWHLHGYAAALGNYLLMMYYTTVAGWMFYYFYSMLTGKYNGMDNSQIKAAFDSLTNRPLIMLICVIIVVVLGFFVCSIGLQKGVERITKFMMIALLVIMAVLAVNSIFLDGGTEGFKFYLIPDMKQVEKIGLWNIIVEAMNQSFFTLSLGMGSMAIFGSYIDKKSSLLKESLTIASLDTFVAIVAGLIIFPACFAFGVNPDSGPNLIFVTLPNIFNEMRYGQIWGGFFFMFMSFAAFSTVIAVFENIMSIAMDLLGWTRKKAAVINIFVILIGSIPCVLGFNILSGIHPLGHGTTVLDFEDFLVSKLILPIGSLIYALFCVTKYGWGYDNYEAEVNTGNGLKMPKFVKPYLKYVLPVIVFIIIAQGLYSQFM